MDGTATGGRDQSIGLLGRPPGARWPDPKAEADPNPFVAFRSLLWSHHVALAAGWTDDRFVDEFPNAGGGTAGHGDVGGVLAPGSDVGQKTVAAASMMSWAVTPEISPSTITWR